MAVGMVNGLTPVVYNAKEKDDFVRVGESSLKDVIGRRQESSASDTKFNLYHQ